MATKTAYTIYHESPPKVAMFLNEGAWTDDDDYKLGGYFASPLDKDTIVTLDTSADFTVKKATLSTDTPIGKLISEPQGEHTSGARVGTVLLFGDCVLECEIHTASDQITVGGYVQFTKSGGYFDGGTWQKDTSNDTVALASTSASGSIATGSVIPVLFGKFAF